MAILKTQGASEADADVTPMMARMTFLFLLPFMFIGPFGGLLADRLPRRLLMVAADVARAALMFSFAALIALTQPLGTWGPFLPLLLVGSFAAIFSPARSALLPTLVSPEQLVRANGMISGLGILATMVSGYLGGVLAHYYAPTVAFRLDALTFVLSAVFLMFIRPPHRPVETDLSFRRALGELRDGVGYVQTHKRVRELLAIGAVVWFCGPLVVSVIPAIARDVYGGSYPTMSLYRALLGLGFLIGSGIVVTLGKALRGEIAITWGLAGVAGGVLTLALSTFLPFPRGMLAAVGAAGVVACGMFGVAVIAGQASLLQRIVSDRVRGRVFGVQDMVTIAGSLIATGALGIPQWTRVDRWVGFILVAVALFTFATAMVTLSVRLRRGLHGSALTFAEHLNEFIARFWYRLERIGYSTVPRRGGVIVTSNHTCAADPILLCAAATHRPLAFMIAQEYARLPILRFFLRTIECIPVTRSGQDTAAFKRAVRHLEAGKALGIFIEGRIVPPGEEGKPRDGVAMLALKTGATVIPAHISGTVYRKSVLGELFKRHRARVRYGRPVDLSDLMNHPEPRQAAKEASERIYRAIKALAPREPSGDTGLAGQPDSLRGPDHEPA